MTESQMPLTDVSACVARARRLVEAGGGGRSLLGIVGAPGSGKSTLAARVVAALGGSAVYVGMDGFHLAQRELRRLGLADRKGAIDTFDAAGYVALLRRLRDADEEVVYAPLFHRDLEEPIAGAVAVPREVPLVVTEGNYLLADHGAFAAVRKLLDDVWFMKVPDSVRLPRLVARHIAYGKSPEAARTWAHGPDQRNAELILATQDRADVLVDLPDRRRRRRR